MTLSLNTLHPLYGNVIECIGVDAGALVSLKTARTFTVDAGASFVTGGTYGAALRAISGGYTRKGASFTPAVVPNTVANPNLSMFIVVNSVSAAGGSGNHQLVSGTTSNTPTINVNSTKMGVAPSYSTVGTLGSAVIDNAAAHSLAFTRQDENAWYSYVDGVQDGTGTSLGYGSSTAAYDQIGGVTGQGSCAADFVWIIWFNKNLSAAEIAELHSSLGAGNAISLVTGQSVAAPPTVTSVSVSPSSATVAGAATQQFTATVNGTDSPAQTVTWGASAGSINSSGLFTAPAATASIQTITVTATSTVDGSKAGTATVTVPATGTPAPTVTTVAVSPSAPTVAGAATQQFTVTVTGTNSPAQTVTWAATAGSINSSGLFTAPAATGTSQTITVMATSTVNGTKSGTATVTVPASVTGQIVSDILVNNAGTALGNTSIRYSWFKAGRIGSLTGIVPTEGVGVTGSDGRLTITGLPAGAGVLFLAQWITNATDDYVAYQPGTVA